MEAKSKTSSVDQHPLLNVTDDKVIPYFMWDYRYTVGQIKQVLIMDNEQKRIWLMAKIMRDARYGDVWKFISLKDVLRHRARLFSRLGRQRDFWEFLYSRWSKQGIIPDGEGPDSVTK